MALEKNREEHRKKAGKISEKELIRDAVRARKFSGTETFLQGIDLINFALKARRLKIEKS